MKDTNTTNKRRKIERKTDIICQLADVFVYTPLNEEAENVIMIKSPINCAVHYIQETEETWGKCG